MSDTNSLVGLGELTAVCRQFEVPPDFPSAHGLPFTKLKFPSYRYRELPAFRSLARKDAVHAVSGRTSTSWRPRTSNFCESEGLPVVSE
jgi:hypothetical protein